MVEPSDEPSFLDRIRSKAHASILGPRKAERAPVLPVSSSTSENYAGTSEKPPRGLFDRSSSNTTSNNVADEEKANLPPPAPPPTSVIESGTTNTTVKEGEQESSVVARFYETTKEIITYSIVNYLLIFVPIGIAVEFAHVSPTIVFAMNAVAIVPLAGLLAHATEAVAASLGDTVGALLNVTFGNAVELIIFIIALSKNEIRIVQASIVGSILSNLLLILGMAFVLGGLRFREQIYNSTVTQMSACLLSLSVASLLLPTAFHASFNDNDLADSRVLELSRASAIILLIVYILYLLFQLKSHSYMYASTPQHVIDEESHPGVLASMLNSSSSSSSSSSETDSDSSSGSHKTSKKIKRALRGKRRRKSSASSKESPSFLSTARNQSFTDMSGVHSPLSDVSNQHLGAIASGDEADVDGENRFHWSRPRLGNTQSRDFENEKPLRSASGSGSNSPVLKSKRKHRQHRQHRQHRKRSQRDTEEGKAKAYAPPADEQEERRPRVAFAGEEQPSASPNAASKRPPINLRSLSRAGMPRLLSSTVFSSANPTGTVAPAGVSVPKAPYGLRRTTSLPDRLNRTRSQPSAQAENGATPVDAHGPSEDLSDGEVPKKHMSRTSAVILLLISTGLVALCAEFLVDSISYIVEHTTVSQAFIGLIILPVVGNAAEHVTAVTVATKNKMDLAIGVAVGSSIQIALFVTPFVVLLGWCMGKEMRLFFSLFETISLFVSAFIINFLILDGRSNYLEGALLIAAYVIIAIGAWFYPDASQQSDIGGSEGNTTVVARGLSMLTGLPM